MRENREGGLILKATPAAPVSPDASLLRRTLAREVGRLFATEVGDGPIRVEVAAEGLEPLRWLREQRAPRLYWSGRGDGLAVAASGVADLQTGEAADAGAGLRRISAVASAAGPGVRYYGGLRFDPTREAGEEWAAFGGYRFVLPRFEVVAGHGGPPATLACNLVFPRDAGRREEILAGIEGLPLPESTNGSFGALPVPLSREDGPDREGWDENIRRALAAFGEGRLGKVVLARRADLGFDREVDPGALLARLAASTPGCFQFCFEPEADVAFVGASPERLYRREGRRVLSEAVAGTRPRLDSAADDAALRSELLASVKDLDEQAYVRDGVREALGPLCEALAVDEGVSEMRLARGRHLVSRVRGSLRDGVADADLLAALHPTPAVGGTPRDTALAEIRASEPFDRGWYAGPVGWIGAGGAEFAVGIRSGLVRGEEMSLYSGAGIVAGSDPAAEWAEIEQKIGDFTRIFGLEPDHRPG